MVSNLLETKLENLKKQYGNDHQNIIMPLNNLSYLHQQQGHHDGMVHSFVDWDKKLTGRQGEEAKDRDFKY